MTRVHMAAGEVPRHLFHGGSMTVLSIFADESGDFGTGSEYYILSLVFHEQNHQIADDLLRLATALEEIGFDPVSAVHTGAIVRGEDEYRTMDVDIRKRAFTRLFAFARQAPFTYQSFHFRKRETPDRLTLKGAISKAVAQYLRDHAEYFLAFDKVIVYYDNGQAEITDVLNTLLNAFFFNVEFRKVFPAQYRLFQVADLCCTLELLKVKMSESRLSRSDLFFFHSQRTLKKYYLDKLMLKRRI